MTVEQQLDAIAKGLLTLRRDGLRTLARTKALEVMLQESIPEDKRKAWLDRLNKHTKSIFSDLLLSFEKQSPGYAALLDSRETWEVSDEV